MNIALRPLRVAATTWLTEPVISYVLSREVTCSWDALLAAAASHSRRLVRRRRSNGPSLKREQSSKRIKD